MTTTVNSNADDRYQEYLAYQYGVLLGNALAEKQIDFSAEDFGDDQYQEHLADKALVVENVK